jgi:hypothetical protein
VRYDDSPERSILLKHKDEGFVPSTPMPAHNAPQSEVREFLLDILLEREVPMKTAKYIAGQWHGGNGLQLQIQNFQTYQCYFEDKNAQVIWRDVHAIVRRESKERQRQRDARRRRAKLAKCEFSSFALSQIPITFSTWKLTIVFYASARDARQPDPFPRPCASHRLLRLAA